MDLKTFTTVSDRRKALEEHVGVSLSKIGTFTLDESQASTRHCENMIGAVQIPVGVAGPLKVQNTEYYIPLATTEGALIASVNRGCKAITQSGEIGVVTEKIGITRAPAFVVKNVAAGKAFIRGVEEHIDILKKVAEATSSHLQLLDVKPWMVGNTVFLRFAFDTKDAMGMNMATIATQKMVEHLTEKSGVACVALSGNMCVDKKANFLNFIEGRGIKVWADIILPKDILFSVLKTTADKLADVTKRKLLYGSVLSGTIGANAHAANILAAIFLATGQDMAHISECSSVVTTVEEQGEDAYVSVYLPDLVIGTVGGGTGLATQQEALSLLGLAGGNEGKNSLQLAEVIGATVLAGEISLLASLAQGSLAKAHESLARGKKV